jgi:uncharacterized protein with HEPN domain
MPKRDPDLLVEDMLEALRKIELYTAGMDHSLFLQDEKTIDAVVRNLEVLGEATRQIPHGFAAEHRSVPWRNITKHLPLLGVRVAVHFQFVVQRFPLLDTLLHQSHQIRFVNS